MNILFVLLISTVLSIGIMITDAEAEDAVSTLTAREAMILGIGIGMMGCRTAHGIPPMTVKGAQDLAEAIESLTQTCITTGCYARAVRDAMENSLHKQHQLPSPTSKDGSDGR